MTFADAIDDVGAILLGAGLRAFGPGSVYENAEGEIVTPSGDTAFCVVSGITNARDVGWAVRGARSIIVQVTTYARDPAACYIAAQTAAEAIPTPPWIARPQSTGGLVNGLATAFQRFEK